MRDILFGVPEHLLHDIQHLPEWLPVSLECPASALNPFCCLFDHVIDGPLADPVLLG